MIPDESRLLDEDDDTSLDKVNTTGATIGGGQERDQFNFTFFKEKR